MRATSRRVRAGLSLAEVVVSTLVVGIVLVGALNCVGAVIRGRLRSGDSTVAKELASQLMAEILENDYQDPVETPVFGREAAESNTVRTGWDDVDDYHLWTARPPLDRSGTALANTTNWQRDVVVEWVDPSNPANTAGSDLGVKRITVIVQRNGVVVTRQVALRSDQYTGAGT